MANLKDTYKKIYCKKLIEHMENGLSYESFAGSLGVARQTLYNWEEKHKEFKLAHEIGVAKSQLFWEELGIKGTAGFVNKFNALSWLFNMKNRFDWKDKKDITTDGEKIPSQVVFEYVKPNKGKKNK